MSGYEGREALDLALVIDMNRDEALELREIIRAALPEQMGAVAGLMATVDVISGLLFGGIDKVHEGNLAKGGDGSDLNNVAREGVRLLQELLNIRLTYELAKRDILACDCPKCREEQRDEQRAAPVSVKLH